MTRPLSDSALLLSSTILSIGSLIKIPVAPEEEIILTQYIEYTVKKGDTVIGIAKSNNLTKEDLLNINVGVIDDEKIVEIIERVFDLRPAAIIDALNLRRPIYKQTAAYGHFGRTDVDLPWEHLDKVDEIKSYLDEIKVDLAVQYISEAKEAVQV